MALFLKRAFVFIIPFLAIIAIEGIIDPFNYFSAEKNKKLIEAKRDISLKKNAYLYTLIEYDREPASTVILGDSRAGRLSPAFFDGLTNEKVANLAGGGGSLEDVIKIFWDISNQKKLKKIYIGISIETYSGTLLKDRVTPSITIKNSMPLYLLNQFTFESTFLICKSMLLNEKINIEKPPFTKEEFWKRQLEIEDRYLNNYSYPKNYYQGLKKIADYCEKNTISLVFFVSPTHVDLQQKIKEYKLEGQYEKFKNDLKSFGDVYDFNFPGIITNDKNNFPDPFHCSDSVSRIVIKEMVLEKPEYSVLTKHNKN